MWSLREPLGVCPSELLSPAEASGYRPFRPQQGRSPSRGPACSAWDQIQTVSVSRRTEPGPWGWLCGPTGGHLGNKPELQQDPPVPSCGREEGHGKRTRSGGLGGLRGRKAVEGSVRAVPGQLQDGRRWPRVQKRTKEQTHLSVDGAVWCGWPRTLPPGKRGDGRLSEVGTATQERWGPRHSPRWMDFSEFVSDRFCSGSSVGTELAPGIMFRQVEKKWQREWPASSEPVVHFWGLCMCVPTCVPMCVPTCAPTLH